jgi:hypothetical protein
MKRYVKYTYILQQSITFLCNPGFLRAMSMLVWHSSSFVFALAFIVSNGLYAHSCLVFVSMVYGVLWLKNRQWNLYWGQGYARPLFTVKGTDTGNVKLYSGVQRGDHVNTEIRVECRVFSSKAKDIWNKVGKNLKEPRP